jgi:hypothetical protein
MERKKGHDMIALHCACGFTELADETLTDHLLLAFDPADGVGGDGRVHEERGLRTCSCGLTASTAGELDEHLLAVFTPAGAIGRDGQRHAVRGAA